MDFLRSRWRCRQNVFCDLCRRAQTKGEDYWPPSFTRVEHVGRYHLRFDLHDVIFRRAVAAHASKLNKGQENFCTNLDTLTDTFCNTNADGKFDTMSRSSRDIIGYRSEEFSDMSTETPFVDPNDGRRFLDTLKANRGGSCG